VGLSIPYIAEGTILASGYNGISAWLFNPYVGGVLGARWTNVTKVAYLTGSKPSDFFKAYLIALPITWIAHMIYVSLFWNMAPIPSALYPWALIQWPINLQMSCLFITRKLTVFRPELILASFAVMTTIGMLGEFAPFPFSLLGLVTGCTTLPPMAISLFIGSSLGNIILRKLGGDEWWNNYRSVIVAGLGAGQGIIIGISTALALVGRSKWVLPY
jgi:hypothetical protein